MNLRKIAKKILREMGPISVFVRHLGVFLEQIAFGGRLRETFLLGTLRAHYASRVRRQWLWQSTGEEPHFSDHRAGGFNFVFGQNVGSAAFGYLRGFFSFEIIDVGDRVLDIGCGDGFLTKRLYSIRASHVDAVDIEKTAISTALKENPASNISYRVLDAVSEDFPGNAYNVVVFDGAIGHFHQQTIDVLLKKIVASLGADGVFCGSESLGHEGNDHLTFFESIDSVGDLLNKHFHYVYLRTMKYQVGLFGNSIQRTEVYWRCSNSMGRFESIGWVRYPMEGED